MHGAPELTALAAWYFSLSLVGVIYLAIGRKPILSRLFIVANSAAGALLAFFALRDVPLDTGWQRGLVFGTMFLAPLVAGAIAGLVFRRLNHASSDA
jgi:hypothetical protein